MTGGGGRFVDTSWTVPEALGNRRLRFGNTMIHSTASEPRCAETVEPLANPGITKRQVSGERQLPCKARL
jgi:hypothetical protein